MTRRTSYSALAPLAAWIVAASLAPQASASGFQLREQSPSAQGTAFAGVTAGGPDIGSMFFNPATMGLFDGNQAVTGFSYVAPKSELERASGRRAAIFPAPTRPISGSPNTGNAAESALLPSLYAMWSVSPDLKLGLSVNAPFGMATDYDDSFVGRYHALKSDLTVMDIAPTIAYRINPQWIVGAAFVARKADAELTNAVDYGAIGAAMGIPGFVPGASDGTASLEGDTWDYGYRLGVTFEPTEKVRLGLAYQNAMTMKLEGDASFTDVPAALAASPSFRNGAASAELALPSNTSLGIKVDVSNALTLHGEVARTGWSSFKEIRIKFKSGAADSVTEEKWDDTWFYALGLSWKVSDVWMLRAGIAYDQGAVPDEYRTPRIPDGDRTWLSAGFGYAVSQRLTVDFAYTHILVSDGKLDLKAVPEGYTFADSPNRFRGDLSGNYENSIDILSAQARFTF